MKNEKLMLIKISHFLSFLYQNLTDFMLLTVCRLKRIHAFVTPNSVVCKHAWWFWLTFLSTVLLGQWWYVPKEKIGLLFSMCDTRSYKLYCYHSKTINVSLLLKWHYAIDWISIILSQYFFSLSKKCVLLYKVDQYMKM